ncbi:MAG: SDR family NAD(P)-dependent oxidoreductase [bacterium]
MKTAGNTILITGGTSGIGLGFAERFLKLGNRVIICGRRENRLVQIKKDHPGIETLTCDVSEAKEREILCSKVMGLFPAINILMNNAGIQFQMNMTKPVNVDQLRMEIETNLTAPVHLTSLFAGYLAAKEEAAVINISSGLAFSPYAIVPVYSATKAALHSVTMSLRYQLRQTSIKVFEIAPPAVDTELGHQNRSDKSQSHGGIPVSELIDASLQAMEKNIFEIPVGMAKDLREKGVLFFDLMNK